MRFLIAVRHDRESEYIMKLLFEREATLDIKFSASKMAFASAVKMELLFERRMERVLEAVTTAAETLLFALEPQYKYQYVQARRF